MEELLPTAKAINDFRLVHGAISFYPLTEEVLNEFLCHEVLLAKNDRAFKYIAVQAPQHLQMHPQKFSRPSRSVQ